MALSPPLSQTRERARSMGCLNIPTSALSRNNPSRQSIGEVALTLSVRTAIGPPRRQSETPYIHPNTFAVDSSEGGDDFVEGFIHSSSYNRKKSLQEVVLPMLPQIMKPTDEVHPTIFSEKINENRMNMVIPEHKFGEIKKSVTATKNFKPSMSLFKPTTMPKMQTVQASNQVMANNAKNCQNVAAKPLVMAPLIEITPPEIREKKAKINKRDINSFAPISM